MEILLVLAHGLFGWVDAASSDFKRDYFYGIKPFLIERCRAKGLTPTIIAPTVSLSESIAVRGGQLQNQIEKALHGMPKGTRTHVIAHSMGGLDTRWAITEGRMGDRIASLTTMGTPHRGTTIADLVLRHVKGLKSAVDLVDQLSDLAHNFARRIKNQDALEFYRHLISNIEQSSPGEIERGLEALTLDGVHAFNQRLAGIEEKVRRRSKRRVIFFSYGGVPSHRFLRLLNASSWRSDLSRKALAVSRFALNTFGNENEKQSRNDGAVSTWSAQYPWNHDPVQTFPCDHFMFLNWRVPETRPGPLPLDNGLAGFYGEMMDRIIQIERAQ